VDKYSTPCFNKMKPRIVLLTSNPEHPLYSSWIDGNETDCRVYAPHSIVWEPPADAGMLVTHLTYDEPGVTLIRKAVEKDIPTLILMDGIIEYRNTWEHPQIVPGAIFQPVMGHKVACLGRAQARTLESWGNHGRCEVVGSPRFDRYQGLKPRPKKDNEPFRILVASAFTPYFTETQHRQVCESLRDLKEFFDCHNIIGGTRVAPVWRLTAGLDQEIGVAGPISDLTGLELFDQLQNVDALITTPSTTIIEAMLIGIPVAVLDYCNTPPYLDAAWRITAARHTAKVIQELIAPPAAKMLYQESQLHDDLECSSPARPRMLRLVSEMMRIGAKAKASGVRLHFPEHILEVPGVPATLPRFAPGKLYPGVDCELGDDPSALRVEILQLRKYGDQLERQRQQLNAELVLMHEKTEQRMVRLYELETCWHCAQIFYAQNNEFVEQLSIRREYRSGVWVRLAFDVPGGRLRLDPTIRIALIEIAAVRVRSKEDNRLLWSAKKPDEFDSIKIGGDAFRLPHQSRLIVLCHGIDPQMVLPECDLPSSGAVSVTVLMKAHTTLSELPGFLPESYAR
jgi:hypothetical protein